jgi:hypothetical protein
MSDSHDQGLIEKKLLQMLSFDVTLDSSEYARVFFNLRDLSRYGQFKELLPMDGEAEAAFRERLEKAQESLKSKGSSNKSGYSSGDDPPDEVSGSDED